MVHVSGRASFSVVGIVATLLPMLLSSCANGPQAHSLSGQPLYAPPMSDQVRADRAAKLAAARAEWRADSNNLEAIVWLGRRTAYMGQYREAIDIYTEGLRIHPREPHLLRHRGHRYISTRQFRAAIADLEQAAGLVAGEPDEVEQDGLPNARGIPTSTLQSNIWYHLGLAFYLSGRLEEALTAYEECKKVSRNPDMLCATVHWYYMTLRRLGRDEEAKQLLAPIHSGLDVIENTGYHRLLLMYRGELTPEQVLGEGEGEDKDAIQSATVGYGVANWHYYNRRSDQARELLDRILDGEQWAAFGYIAAEADLHRR